MGHQHIFACHDYLLVVCYNQSHVDQEHPIGITADSFIVYFERIRDELREGRNLESAVEAGWKRAIRTILISDAVSFTAAVVLYLLTSSSVRGFAFTLGLTTLIDLLVVTMFTHPLVQLLARNKFFASGHRHQCSPRRRASAARIRPVRSRPSGSPDAHYRAKYSGDLEVIWNYRSTPSA